MGQWSAAAAAYQQALQLDPAMSQAHRLLGEAYCRLDQPAAALAAYLQALQVDQPGEAVDQAVAYLAQYGSCPP